MDKKVLIIDDDEIDFQILDKALNKKGIYCKHSKSLQAGITAILDGIYDLIVIDYNLPGTVSDESITIMESLGVCFISISGLPLSEKTLDKNRLEDIVQTIEDRINGC